MSTQYWLKKAIEKFNYTVNLDQVGNETMFLIIEKVTETFRILHEVFNVSLFLIS